MDRKIKTLNILLIIHILLGALGSAYGTFATFAMGGPVIAIPVFIFTFGIFVYLPYYARKSLASCNAMPCIIHAALVIAFYGLLLPLGIWQIYLAIKVNNNMVKSNA